MFGKVHPGECSLIPAPGASDNLFALFCEKKVYKVMACLTAVQKFMHLPNEYIY